MANYAPFTDGKKDWALQLRIKVTHMASDVMAMKRWEAHQSMVEIYMERIEALWWAIQLIEYKEKREIGEFADNETMREEFMNEREE